MEATAPAGVTSLVLQPHDLIRVRNLGDLVPAELTPPRAGRRPPWVQPATGSSRGLWAVVRRDATAAPSVAAGIRGGSRAERWAVVIDHAAIVEVVHPWQVPLRARPERSTLPVFEALQQVRETLSGEKTQRWGPGGSAAYELVTGIDTVGFSSDLDLVFTAAEPLDREHMRRLGESLKEAADTVRIDVQVQTPHGGFALEEWLRVGKGGELALKTENGPRLVSDPWATDESEHEKRNSAWV